MAYRIDRGTLRSPRKTADGRMVVDALLSRTGVYVYRNPDGSERREYRPDSTVFDPAAMRSFELKPVTALHPSQAVGNDQAAAKQLGKGLVLEGLHRDGIHMAGTLLVDDADLFAAMQRGDMVETSLGYEADIDETPGVSPDGERYDAKQIAVRGDHAAIVPRGRAGSSRVKMDCFRADASEMIDYAGSPSGAPAAKTTKQDHEAFMEKLQEQLAAAIKEAAEQKVRADQADKDLKAAKEQLAEVTGNRDSHKARADKAEDDLKTAKADVDKARSDAAAASPATVKARVALERKAIAVLGKDAKVSDKLVEDATDEAIMLAVVKKADNVDVDVKANGAAYLKGRFDACTSRSDAGAEALGKTREKIEEHRNDSPAGGEGDKEAKARKDMVERNRYGAKKEGK